VVCDAGTLACRTVPVDCNDNNACTADSCSTAPGFAVCINDAIPCNFTDLCFPAACNSSNGACYVTPVNCDDGILCTIDSCNAGVCSNILNTCNDNNNCTVDSCDNLANTTTGCVNEALICPGNPCFAGLCNISTGCYQEPIPCSTNGTGFCESKTCDETVGCLAVPRTCLLSQEVANPSLWSDQYTNLWKYTAAQVKYKDTDCFTATCDATMQKCVVNQREPWSSTCAFAYLEQGKKAAILTAGAIAGVAVAAVIFAALAGFGAKKGYDAWVRMKDERMGAASTNPMYAPSSGSGTNALYT